MIIAKCDNGIAVGYIPASDGKKHQSNTVYAIDNVSPATQATDYKSPIKILIKNEPKVINNDELPTIRKLTPKECWRLMGFDDSDFEKAEQVNSNTQLYKQAGNSIVVNCLEGIFYELFKNTEYMEVESEIGV